MPLTFNPNKVYSNEQKALKRAVHSLNYPLASELIKDKSIFDQAMYYYLLKKCFTDGYLDLFTLILKESAVDPSLDKNEIISSCVEERHYDFAVLLLEYKNVDPTMYNSHVIKNTDAYGFNQMTDLFFAREDVRVALKKDDIELYKLLKLKNMVKVF